MLNRRGAACCCSSATSPSQTASWVSCCSPAATSCSKSSAWKAASTASTPSTSTATACSRAAARPRLPIQWRAIQRTWPGARSTTGALCSGCGRRRPASLRSLSAKPPCGASPTVRERLRRTHAQTHHTTQSAVASGLTGTWCVACHTARPTGRSASPTAT